MDTPVSDLRILVDGVDLAGGVKNFAFQTPRMTYNLDGYFDDVVFMGSLGFTGFACCAHGIWTDEHAQILAALRDRGGECLVTVIKDDLALEVPCDVVAFRSVELADGRTSSEAAFVLAKSLHASTTVAWKELVA